MRISVNTVVQYKMVSKLINEFEHAVGKQLYIWRISHSTQRLQQKESKYWRSFYRQFCDFLYRDKKYYDAYVAGVFKIIKTFFNYLAIEKGLDTGNFHKRFRVPANNTTPIVLTPEQLRFLIMDQTFDSSLSHALKRTKDIFVFGCTVGLRYSDLMGLKKTSIHQGVRRRHALRNHTKNSDRSADTSS